VTYHYTTLDKEESAIHVVVAIVQYITRLNLNCSCMLLQIKKISRVLGAMLGKRGL
jgi:hypothetical protein